MRLWYPAGMVSTIDLHSHSTASDGTLSPSALIARARAQGVRRLALTDHDTVAGLEEAAAAAHREGIELIPGIELSTVWSERTMHVVGLGIDPQAPPLRTLLAKLDALREARARRIGERLAACGIVCAYERARELAGAALPTRTHFARVLVERGKAASVGDVFKRYLVPGKPGYVRSEWPPLDEVVAAIEASGGIAVLAHPHSQNWTGAWSRRILEAFIAAGGRAVEVVCGNSTRDSILVWGGHARRYGLLASVGSDFHEPGGWIELGRLAELPADLKPVWEG